MNRFLNKFTLLAISNDGFLRVYDLIKNKRFRVLSAPKSCQLISLAVDTSSNDFVFTGAFDPYDIQLFSVKMNAFIGKRSIFVTKRLIFWARSPRPFTRLLAAKPNPRQQQLGQKRASLEALPEKKKPRNHQHGRPRPGHPTTIQRGKSASRNPSERNPHHQHRNGQY